MTWTILLRALPVDLRDTVAGDMQEEFLERRVRDGSLRANAWVWWTAARVAVAFRLEGLTHVRGVPPIGDELRSRGRVLDTLRQDVAFSVRLLCRQPGFTVVALIALALGIGANTAMFGVVDAVLWRPLPYADADRILSLSEQRPSESRWFGQVSPADFFDWRRDASSFASMAAFTDVVFNMTGTGEPERVPALRVTPGFLDVLGMKPALGRDFRPDEETWGRHRVMLLTDAFWRHRFGAEPNIVGTRQSIEGIPYEIVGVLPRAFWWPSHPDIVSPLALDDHDRAMRSAHFFDVVGRLKSGVTSAQAHQELAVLGEKLAQMYPIDNARHFPNTRPVRDALVGDTRPALLVLLGAVGFVLLIACANVATLLLARAAGRQKELAVRKAVGASRGRLVRQLLTESVLLALAGGALGLLIAAWGLAGLRAIVPVQFESLPGIDHLGLDTRILGAAFVITLLTGVVFGALPALVASDERLNVALNDESRGSSGSRRAQRLRAGLVSVELALSLVLLTGAALLIASFDRVSRVAPGFRSDQLVVTRLQVPAARYEDHQRTAAFFQDLLSRLRSIPGVSHAAATSSPPFGGPDSRLNLTIENFTPDFQGPVRAHPRLVTADYLATMGIPLRRGRALSDADGTAARPVALINETAARIYWRGRDPIGQRISLGRETDWMEVVGIVGDVRHSGLDTEARPEVYIPHRQPFTSLGTGLARSMAVVVRSSTDTAATANAIRAVVRSLDPQLPMGLVRSMDDMIAASVAPLRLNLVLVTAFAFVAVVLTAAGLYGVMSYLVTQRTREIGVRMALGASRGQVLRLMIRQAGTMTLVGIALGVAGALGVTRFMSALLFDVNAADPSIYAGVSILLALVALAAVAVPSSRATRVDPLAALRDS